MTSYTMFHTALECAQQTSTNNDNDDTMTKTALPQHKPRLHPNHNHHNNFNNSNRYEIRVFPIVLSLLLLLVAISYLFLALHHGELTLSEDEVKHKLVDSAGSMPIAPKAQGVFKGTGWWNADRTVDKVILAETPFARCEAHSVMSEDGKTLVKDWLWMEERDHVNVAVLSSDSSEFIVMRQKKYGIEGESLSTVGGFVEEGESPFDAALREVAEELGMGSKVTRERLGGGILTLNLSLAKNNESVNDNYSDGSIRTEETEDWIFLGKYRTSTNRGGGFVYDYFLKNAVPIYENGGTSAYKGTGEGENQTLLQMSIDDTIEAVKDANFKEVKWTNALSLSLVQILTGVTLDKPYHTTSET